MLWHLHVACCDSLAAWEVCCLRGAKGFHQRQTEKPLSISQIYITVIICVIPLVFSHDNIFDQGDSTVALFCASEKTV